MISKGCMRIFTYYYQNVLKSSKFLYPTSNIRYFQSQNINNLKEKKFSKEPTASFGENKTFTPNLNSNLDILRDIENRIKSCDQINVVKLLKESRFSLSQRAKESEENKQEMQKIFLNIYENNIKQYLPSFNLYDLANILNFINNLYRAGVKIEKNRIDIFPSQIIRALQEKQGFPEYLLFLTLKCIISLKMDTQFLVSLILSKTKDNSIKVIPTNVDWTNQVIVLKLLAQKYSYKLRIGKFMEQLSMNILTNFKYISLKDKLLALNIYLNFYHNLHKSNVLSNAIDSLMNISIPLTLLDIRNIFEMYQSPLLKNSFLLKEAIIQFQEQMLLKNRWIDSARIDAHYLLYAKNPDLKQIINPKCVKDSQEMLVKNFKSLIPQYNLLLNATSYLIGEKIPLTESQLHILVNYSNDMEKLQKLEETLLPFYGGNLKELNNKIFSLLNIDNSNLEKLNIFSKYISERRGNIDDQVFNNFIDKVSSVLDNFSFNVKGGWFRAAIELSKNELLRPQVSQFLSKAFEYIKTRKDFYQCHSILESEFIKGLHINIKIMIKNYIDNFNFYELRKDHLKDIINKYFVQKSYDNFYSPRSITLINDFLEKSQEITKNDNNFLFMLFAKLYEKRLIIPKDSYVSITLKLSNIINNLKSEQLNLNYEIYLDVLKNYNTKNKLLDYFTKIFPLLNDGKIKNIILACMIETNPQIIFNYIKPIQNFLNNFKFINQSEIKEHHLNLIGVLIDQKYPSLVISQISSIIQSLLKSETSPSILLSLIPIVNTINNQEILDLYNSNFSRILLRTKNSVFNYKFFASICNLINPTTEFISSVDKTIAEHFNKHIIDFKEIFQVSKIFNESRYKMPQTDQVISNKIQELLNQNIIQKNILSKNYFFLKGNFPAINKLDQYRIVKKLIIPENILSKEYLKKLNYLIKLSKFDLKINTEIKKEFETIINNQKISNEKRTEINQIKYLILNGSYLIEKKDLTIDEIKRNIDEINMSSKSIKELNYIEILMLYYLKNHYQSLKTESNLNLKYNQNDRIFGLNYTKLKKCLDFLKVSYKNYLFEPVQLNIPIFIPELNKLVIIDENNLACDLIKLYAKEFVKIDTILIPNDYFKKIDYNKLTAKKLIDEGIKITSDINSIPLSLFPRKDIVIQSDKNQEIKAHNIKEEKHSQLPEENDPLYNEMSEGEGDFDLNEDFEKDNSSFKDKHFKFSSQEVMHHNPLQNECKFSFYTNSKKNFSNITNLKFKDDSELSDAIEDQSDYSFESSEVELDSLHYQNINDTSTGVSTMEESSLISQPSLHNTLIGQAFCKDEEPLLPELLLENMNFDKSNYGNLSGKTKNGTRKLNFNFGFN